MPTFRMARCIEINQNSQIYVKTRGWLIQQLSRKSGENGAHWVPSNTLVFPTGYPRNTLLMVNRIKHPPYRTVERVKTLSLLMPIFLNSLPHRLTIGKNIPDLLFRTWLAISLHAFEPPGTMPKRGQPPLLIQGRFSTREWASLQEWLPDVTFKT